MAGIKNDIEITYKNKNNFNNYNKKSNTFLKNNTPQAKYLTM